MHVEGAVHIVHCHHLMGRPDSRFIHCSDNAHHSKGSRSGSSAGSICQWSPSVYNNPQLSLTFLTLTHILWNSSQFAFVCYMFMTKSRSCAFGRDITEAMQSSHCILSGGFDLCGFEDVHFDHLMKGVCVCQASPQPSPYFPCFCNKKAFCR